MAIELTNHRSGERFSFEFRPVEKMTDNIIGRTYLEHGKPVRVLVRWSGRGPRNVLIERGDGSRVVRPRWGLRRVTDPPRTDPGR